MGLTPQVIMIIAIVFGGGFLLMIPFAIMQSRRKKREAGFTMNNQDKAVLHLYAEQPVIDGSGIKELGGIRGQDLQYTVALPAGSHHINAKYTCTSVGMGKNINYKTPKPIDSEIELEAGHEYTLSIYFYSPEERRNYYNGDVGEDIYTQVLDIKGSGIGGYTKAYIIGYKEK